MEHGYLGLGQLGLEAREIEMLETRFWYWIIMVIPLISVILSLSSIIIIVLSMDSGRHEYFPTKRASLQEQDTILILPFLKQFIKGEMKLSENSLGNAATTTSAHVGLTIPDRIPGTELETDPNFANHHPLPTKLNVSDASSTTHSRGVELKENGLHILHPGLYYIYSSVNFHPNSKAFSAEFAHKTWFHYIDVHSYAPNTNNEERTLARNVHTTCPNCTDFRKTSFIGGIHQLSAGDVVSVSLSGQGFVDFDKETTYLGLFKLSSDQTH